MASEVLAVPERHLADVIKVIRRGLAASKGRVKGVAVHQEVREQLKKWCDEEEEYLNRLTEDCD